MALGGRAQDVVTMLLGQSLRPILLGRAFGAAGGYGLSRVFIRLFWRMAVADPLVLGAISTLMLAAALAAAWVPVRRVLRIGPHEALRYE